MSGKLQSVNRFPSYFDVNKVLKNLPILTVVLMFTEFVVHIPSISSVTSTSSGSDILIN